jgi:hypothetical protein
VTVSFPPRVCLKCGAEIPSTETAFIGTKERPSDLLGGKSIETVGPFCETCWCDGAVLEAA